IGWTGSDTRWAWPPRRRSRPQRAQRSAQRQTRATCHQRAAAALAYPQFGPAMPGAASPPLHFGSSEDGGSEPTGGGGYVPNSATDAGPAGAGGSRSSNAVPYNSQTVMNNAATMGPTMKPSGPNSTSPPNVETRITMSGSSVSLPTS